MIGVDEAVSTLYGGSHKIYVNQRLAGADRRNDRRRKTFLPNQGAHSDFLRRVFDRSSQLPNPIYMETIEPSSIISVEAEVGRAAALAPYVNKEGGPSPEERQVALYRILLAGLKPFYMIPAAQKTVRQAPA